MNTRPPSSFSVPDTQKRCNCRSILIFMPLHISHYVSLSPRLKGNSRRRRRQKKIDSKSVDLHTINEWRGDGFESRTSAVINGIHCASLDLEQTHYKIKYDPRTQGTPTFGTTHILHSSRRIGFAACLLLCDCTRNCVRAGTTK